MKVRMPAVKMLAPIVVPTSVATATYCAMHYLTRRLYSFYQESSTSAIIAEGSSKSKCLRWQQISSLISKATEKSWTKTIPQEEVFYAETLRYLARHQTRQFYRRGRQLTKHIAVQESGVNVHNAMLEFYTRYQRRKQVKEVWKMMNTKNTSSYNHFLNMIIRTGQRKLVQSTYREMIEKGNKPNNVTFNIMLGFFSKELQTNSMLQIYNAYIEKYRPSSYTFASVFRGFLKGCHAKHLEKVKQDFCLNTQAQTTESYTALIGACGRIYSDYENISQLYKEMTIKKIVVNRQCCTELLKTAIVFQQPLEAFRWLGLYSVIPGLPQDITGHIMLLHWAIKTRHYDLAEWIRYQAQLQLGKHSSNILRAVWTRALTLNRYYEAAASELEIWQGEQKSYSSERLLELARLSIAQDNIGHAVNLLRACWSNGSGTVPGQVFTLVIAAHARYSHHHTVLQLWNELVSAPPHPQISIPCVAAAVVHGLGRLGDPHKVLNFWRYKYLRKANPTANVQSAIITALGRCKAPQLLESFLLEIGINPKDPDPTKISPRMWSVIAAAWVRCGQSERTQKMLKAAPIDQYANEIVEQSNLVANVKPRSNINAVRITMDQALAAWNAGRKQVLEVTLPVAH